jgi:hypothetical protein
MLVLKDEAHTLYIFRHGTNTPFLLNHGEAHQNVTCSRVGSRIITDVIE